MRVILTADLHYNIARSIAPTDRLAAEINEHPAEALVIVGDVGGRDLGILRRGLRLFDRFAGRRFFVAGNHDLWVDPGESSLERYERQLPMVCAEAGFHCLDASPFIMDGIGIVGSVGWYDYSFRAAALGVPLRFYEHKIGPAAAARLPEYRHLIASENGLGRVARSIATRWMDGQHVRLGMSDSEFTQRLVDHLTDHLATVRAAGAQQVLVAMHHLPFASLLPVPRDPKWDFAHAFLGSEAFGEVLRRTRGVRYVVCGHTHQAAQQQIGPITCINVGSTYRDKRYVELDLPAPSPPAG